MTTFAPDLFAGQACIVTGGGSDSGLATTREPLKRGARVTVRGPEADELEVAHEALESDLRAATCDLRGPERVSFMTGSVLRVDGGQSLRGDIGPTPEAGAAPGG